MIAELSALETITVFVGDLAAAKKFYANVFGWQVVYQDEVSAVMKLDNLMINLLDRADAPQLVAPARIAAPNTGPQMLFTIRVKDVNKICAELKERGVTLLNGPLDRPWGRRTAAFCDVDGNVWEVAQIL